MQPRGLPEEYRTALLRVVTDRQHVIEILPGEFIHMLRAVRGDVDADFLHDRYCFGANGAWLCARALHREAFSRIAPQQAFGHLRPSRVSCAQDEHSLFTCHAKVLSLCEALQRAAPVWATTAPAIGKGTSQRTRPQAGRP